MAIGEKRQKRDKFAKPAHSQLQQVTTASSQPPPAESMSCSLVVAKLISNSCAPPPPTRIREMKEPQSQGAAVLGLCYWVGGE